MSQADAQPILTARPPVRPGSAMGAQATAELKRLIVPALGGLLVWALIFQQEIVAAVRTWDASTAYNHCFLIIPIFLYMLWDRRGELIGVRARPTLRALPLGIPLAIGWMGAERLGIMEGRQLLAISFAQVLFYSLLGPDLWKRMAGPFLYLYFLVPFGEFLTPRLQDITTEFVRYGLIVLNIPAYVDGYVIEIPQGTFLIAEACAGLRFLIASIAFGYLYAILMYRSTTRRTMFIAASIVVPIVANGFRGLGIVYLGYLLGSAQAAAADHVLYGWIFFSIVILILIAVGLPFRQDEQPYRTAKAMEGPDSQPFRPRKALLGTLAILLMAGIGPLAAAFLARSATASPLAVNSLDLGSGCRITSGPEVDPAHPTVHTERVACGSYEMDLAWEYFSPHVTAAAVMGERRRLIRRVETESQQEAWLHMADGAQSSWRVMHSNEPVYDTAVSIWNDGKPARPGMGMRMRMALNSVMGSRYAPAIVTVTPVVDWDNLSREDRRAIEDNLKDFLRAYPQLTDRVSALSQIR